jgi:Haemolymph juvenile hormone binding protein (JHBP)
MKVLTSVILLICGFSFSKSGTNLILTNLQTNKVLCSTEPSICSLGAQDLNDCLKKSFNENWPLLHNPKPNENYPSIDPFFFDYGKVQFNRSKLFRGTFAIKNMTLEGPKSLKFQSVETSSNETNMVVTAISKADQLVASGFFRSNLQVAEFSLKTNGQFHLICDEIKAKFVMNGDLTEGGKRFDIQKFDLFTNIKNMKFNITGLEGDKNFSKFKFL